mgnify:CR=1 FL=1
MGLTPKEIVNELDKYIIGQDKAKKAVAVALRNRYRRSKLSQELRDEITPKNIAKEKPEGFSKFSAPLLKFFMTLLTPINFIFTLWKQFIAKVFKLGDEDAITGDEILTMVEEAEELKADAIVNVRYASSAIMQGAAEVIVYGTAVKFVKWK